LRGNINPRRICRRYLPEAFTASHFLKSEEIQILQARREGAHNAAGE
jgi:hypothetical protein